MVVKKSRGSSQQLPGLGGQGGCTGFVGMLGTALLFISLPWGAQVMASANISTALGHTSGHYLSIGDGSVTEFDFPEKSEGIIVISSQIHWTDQWDRPQPHT